MKSINKFKNFKKRILSVVCAATLISGLVPCTGSAASIGLLAFPGAEGAGKYATGGRGGRVYHVTNLNDSGTGSFRDAVSGSNRIVVFDVGGTIELKSDVVVKGNVTIAGQTAPGGGGITLKNYKLGMGGDNIIIRYVSSRPGEGGKKECDAWGGSAGSNSIIDHCSIGWANDEQFGLYSNNMNQTVQYSIIGPANCISSHSKGSHGFGVMFGKGQNSWHHNMIAHNSSRNFRGKVAGTNSMDFVNNVMYNWGYQTGYGTLGRINYVNNYLKAGNSTKGSYHFFIRSSGTGLENYKFYVTGNKIMKKDGTAYSDKINNDNWEGVGFDRSAYGSDNPFVVKDVNGNDASVVANAQTADEAFETVLAYAGAGISGDKRPRIDREVMDEAENGTGYLTGGGDFNTTNSELQSAISTYNIKYVDYNEYYPAAITEKEIVDSDNDGMPDDWEIARGLDPNKDDAMGDYLGQGYNNIEYYINDLTIDSFPEGVVTLSASASDLGEDYYIAKADIEALTLNVKSIKKADDLVLPQSGGINGCKIEWASSSNAIKLKENQVSEVKRGNSDKSVSLCATIKSGEYTLTKYFNVTVVSGSTFWKASDKNNGLAAGSELFDGLTTLFGATYKAAAVTIGDASFNGYISSSESGSFADGVATGTAFKYVAEDDGYLTVYVTKLGNSAKAKTLYITEEGAESSENSIASISANGTNEMLSGKVEAGKTYYVYVDNSKGGFLGIEFSQTAKPVWWTATKNVTAGDEMMKGLSASENLTYKATVKEFDGVSFSACAAGSTNPADNGKSGAALKYEAYKNGTFTVFCKVGSGKTLQINDEDGNVINSWVNEDVNSDFSSLSAEVEVGKTYYAYVINSKAEFYGASFIESSDQTVIPPENETPAVVEKVTKNGNTISFKIENANGMTIDTYIASYRNNVLDFIYKSSNIVSDGQVSFDCEQEIPSDAKVFVWDDMAPLYDSCILYSE